MADLLEDFGAYFSSAGLLSSTAFGIDHMPDKPASCVAVYEYAGSNGPPQVAGSSRSVQIVVRDESSRAAKMKADEIYRALDVEDGILNLTPERWCAIYLRQTPFKLKVDEQNRTYYAFNVGVTTFND